MLCIHLKNNDPYFCLAAEEYLVRNFEEDIFMLWQSHNTVIVGKHQNLLAEINYPFCWKNNITLARRISGGGTVFHDAGNVNFTFIRNVMSPAEISFKQFTQPIVDTLARIGIKAETSGRNDLMVEGKKISGNAEHVFKNRVLHHGTLLFNSDLENLGQALKVVPGKYQSKAIQSNRSEVVNIFPFLKKELNVEEFVRFLFEFQLENLGNSRFELGEHNNRQIEKLVIEKFNTWDWLYGYSPGYSFKNELNLEGKIIRVELEVKKGIIQEFQISGNYFSEKEMKTTQLELQNKKHCFETILEVLGNCSSKFPDEMIYFFF
jgi:lipoate---protein ligase